MGSSSLSSPWFGFPKLELTSYWLLFGGLRWSKVLCFLLMKMRQREEREGEKHQNIAKVPFVASPNPVFSAFLVMSSLGVLALRHPLRARGVCAASSSRFFSVLRHGGALAQQQAHNNKSSSSSSQLEKSSSEAKGGQLQVRQRSHNHSTAHVSHVMALSPPILR